MTIAELIAELQRQPNHKIPVVIAAQIKTGEIIQPAETVRFEGGRVAITS